MSDVQGIDILRGRRGTMYDPRIVDAFIGLIPALREEDRRIDPPPSAGTADAGAAGGRGGRGRGERQSGRLASSIAEVAMPSASAFTDQVRRLVPGAEACFFTPDKDGGELVVARATRAMPPPVMSLRVPVGEGLAGWVAVNRHTIVNSHADLDLGDVARELGLGVCTATPVFVLGELRGVVAVYLPSPRRFSESEARAVGALAQMMGMTMAQQQFAIGTGVIADARRESVLMAPSPPGSPTRGRCASGWACGERAGVRGSGLRDAARSHLAHPALDRRHGQPHQRRGSRGLRRFGHHQRQHQTRRCDRRAPRRAVARAGIRRTSISDARNADHESG